MELAGLDRGVEEGVESATVRPKRPGAWVSWRRVGGEADGGPAGGEREVDVEGTGQAVGEQEDLRGVEEGVGRVVVGGPDAELVGVDRVVDRHGLAGAGGQLPGVLADLGRRGGGGVEGRGDLADVAGVLADEVRARGPRRHPHATGAGRRGEFEADVDEVRAGRGRRSGSVRPTSPEDNKRADDPARGDGRCGGFWRVFAGLRRVRKKNIEGAGKPVKSGFQVFGPCYGPRRPARPRPSKVGWVDEDLADPPHFV